LAFLKPDFEILAFLTHLAFFENQKYCLSCTAPDLDGGEPGAQVWWEAPCADTESLGRG